MKKCVIAVALWCGLVCSPAHAEIHAKTFVAVLWPMFGPLPAIGLVELASEIRGMPDVEVKTYLHEEWPELVNDIAHLPAGTRTVVVGYSLGANATTWVANKSKYIDVIIALQPSLLSWNPRVTGDVGHYIEVYNPNSWETLGGMGSKKLEGGHIEYIANHDSHPGAQFDPDFRNLVKNEITKISTEDRLEIARADSTKLTELAQNETRSDSRNDAKSATKSDSKSATKSEPVQSKPERVAAVMPKPAAPAPRAEPAKAPVREAAAREVVAQVQQAQPQHDARHWQAFLDSMSGAVHSGALPEVETQTPERRLTLADMTNYAKRAYASGTLQRDTVLASAAPVDRDMPDAPCNCLMNTASGNADVARSAFLGTDLYRQIN